MAIGLFIYYRVIPILLIITALFTASVGATYTQIGTSNYDYVTGAGIFDENLNPVQTGSVNILSKPYPPLVSDLDNDGTNEIVLLDGTLLEIFQNTTLDAVTSLTISNVSSYVHMILYDIDGDGRDNIIIASNSSYIQSFSFNGTAINKNMQMGLDTPDPAQFKGNGEIIIGCMATNRCVAVYPEQSAGISTNDLYAMGFDSTGANGTALRIGVGGVLYCFAREKQIAVNQRSGNNYFVVSASNWDSTTGENLQLYGLEILGNLSIVEHYQVEVPEYDMISGNPTIGSGSDCYHLQANDILPQNSFTSPSSMEVIGAGDEEIIIGYMTSSGTFRMRMYDSDGNTANSTRYPSSQTAEGTIVSNVMRGRIFGNGKSQDFCVMGYDENADRIDLLCGSEQGGTPTFAKSEEFFFENIDTYGFKNITDTYYNLNSMIHSGEHKGGSSSTSEIITTYGVFQIDYTTQLLGATPGVNSVINLINKFSTQNTTVIPVDYENASNTDMLMLSPTNLFYLNDGFINTGGEISQVTYNPCVQGTVLKENTTLQVQLIVTDFNNDNVRGGVTFYSGDSNEITYNQTTYVSSGSTLAFSTTVNKSINSGIIRLFSNDVVNPNSVDEETQTFTVDTNGIVFNSQTCTQNYTTTTSSSTLNNASASATASNPAQATANLLEATTGLSKFSLWLLVMFVVAFTTIGGFAIKHANGEHINGFVLLGVVIVEQMILMFIGKTLNFLPLSFIIVTAIIGCVVIGLWIASMIAGERRF